MLFVVSLLYSCDSESESTKQGQKNGKCFADNTCEEGLYCLNNKCLVKKTECDGVTCSNHGVCVIENALPKCECENYYYADGIECKDVPKDICLSPSANQQLTFADVTEETELGKSLLKVTGSNIVVTDIDNDNWPDIFVSKGDKNRETPETPKNLYRLLKNIKGLGFNDVTWTSGLFKTQSGENGRVASFSIFADINRDGFKDAFVASYTDSSANIVDSSDIFFNNGDGTFTIQPNQKFTTSFRDPVASVAFLDYNKDGYLDIYVGHHYGTYGDLGSCIGDNLFEGDGFGLFSDATVKTNLKTQPTTTQTLANGKNHKPTWGVTACDIDGDGWTDLMSTSYGRQFNMFYKNNNGVFEDLTLTSGFSSDANLNYSDNEFYLCYCKYNKTKPECEGAGNPHIGCDPSQLNWNVGVDDQPYRLGGNSSNAVCGDIDNDGDTDLLNIELAHWHIGQSSDKTQLLKNNNFPQNPLERLDNETMGIKKTYSMSDWNEGDLGGMLVDFDNDGKLDIFVLSSDYPGTTSLLYKQNNNGTFDDITESSNTKIHRAHGGSLIDYDRDGDYDLLVGTSLMRWSASDNPARPEDAFVYLLENKTGQNNNKLMIDISGKGFGGKTNKDAIGTKIIAKVNGKQYVREVQGGFGLYGFQYDPLIIIGTGDNCVIDELIIKWNNEQQTVSTFTNVKTNYVLEIKEDYPLKYIPLKEYAK